MCFAMLGNTYTCQTNITVLLASSWVNFLKLLGLYQIIFFNMTLMFLWSYEAALFINEGLGFNSLNISLI